MCIAQCRDERLEEVCLDEMSELNCRTTFYGEEEKSNETIKDKGPYAIVEKRGGESREGREKGSKTVRSG